MNPIRKMDALASYTEAIVISIVVLIVVFTSFLQGESNISKVLMKNQERRKLFMAFMKQPKALTSTITPQKNVTITKKN